MKAEIEQWEDGGESVAGGLGGYDHTKRRVYRFIFWLVAGTGFLSAAFGYRDELLLGFAIATFLAGFYMHVRIVLNVPVKVSKEKVRGSISWVVLFFTSLVMFFATVDNVKIAVLTAIVQQDTEGYTTLKRCVLGKENSKCLHETSNKVIVYTIANGDVIDTNDMTNTILKYTNEQGLEDGVEDIPSWRIGDELQDDEVGTGE